VFVCFDATFATTAAPTGDLDQCYNGKPWDGSATPSSPADTPVAVTTGTITPNINASLAAAGAVSGKVVDSAGPVAQAQVRVFDTSGSEHGFGVPTGTDGTYLVKGLPAGSYFVCIDALSATGSSTTGYVNQCYNGHPWDGSTPDSTTATPVAVTLGAVHAGIGATLIAGGAISGKATDSSGPVANAVALVFTASGAFQSAAETAADGTYTFSALPSGTYFVCFTGGSATGHSTTGYLPQCYSGKPWDGLTPPSSPADTSVTVTAGATTSGVNALMKPGAAITGKAVDSVGAVSYVNVLVYDSSHTVISNSLTGPDGTYAVGGLPTGSYFVCFQASFASGSSATGYHDQCYNGAPWDGATAPSAPTDTAVAVTTGSAKTNINATLAPA
jgi:hypothetical protein